MRHGHATLLLSALCAVACGATPPSPELRNARVTYARARAGAAAEANPAGLFEARQALEAAERVEEDDPGSEDARSLAYIAQRRALLAETNARAAAARARKLEAEGAIAEKLRDAKARTAPPTPAR